MKTVLAVVVLVALQSVGTQTKPPKGTANSDKPLSLSKEFQEAGQLAYEAMERLSDYNDKPEVSYEPRRLDAEKAIAEAKRKAKATHDKHVAEVLENWLSGLDGQRRFAPGDVRISNAATIARAYGEQSKQAIAANRRALEAQTNADVIAAANLAKSCDNYSVGSQEAINCRKGVIAKLRTFQDNLAAGKSQKSLAPLGPTPALDYWEQTIFPCAVEASWYFGEKLTKEGIEAAQKSTCAPTSSRS